MRKARSCTVIAVAASLLALTATAAGAANTAPAGVGTAGSNLTIFGVSLGTTDPSVTNPSLLGARLIGDLGTANNDPRGGQTAALARLAQVVLSSQTVPALNLSLPAQPVQAQSPGGQPSVSTPGVNLASLVPGSTTLGVPAAIATGGVSPATLSATLDSAGAHSGISAGLTGVSLASGLVGLGSATAKLADNATTSSAGADRSIQTGPVTVLTLGQLLGGLGIPLTDLPVSTLSSLLAQLKELVPALPGTTALPGGGTLAGVVNSLDSAIAGIDTTLGVALPAFRAATVAPRTAFHPLTLPIVGTTGTPVDTVGTPTTPTGLPGGAVTSTISTAGNLTASTVSTLTTDLGPLLGQLGLNVPTTLSGLTALLNTLQADLASELSQALALLSTAPLLHTSGIQLTVSTLAGPTLSGSHATMSANVGSVQVGNLLSTPQLSSASTPSQISSAVGIVTSTISGVLDTVNPGLGGLVKVSVLTPAPGSGLSSAAGYVKAVEGLTALTATINPPADLASIVSTIQSAASTAGATVATAVNTVGGLLAQAGAPSNALGTLTSAVDPITSLTQTLGATLGALAHGAVLQVGTVNAASEFTPAPVGSATTPTSGTPGTPGSGGTSKTPLPFTGGNAAVGAFGGLLLAVLVGVRGWRRRVISG